MTPGDLTYLKKVIADGYVKGPVLEVGGRSYQGVEGNAHRVCAEAGIEWQATDIEPGEGVAFVLDILDQEAVEAVGRTWPTVLLLNLLEHVYDPISALRNALELVGIGGSCVVLTPAIWELHDFPRDFWRPMPDFYLEFARREGLD